MLGLVLVASCCAPAQVSDRLTLVRLPTGGAPTANNNKPLDFVDVYTRGLGGFPTFQWPHLTRIPAQTSPGGGPFAGPSEVLLALADACRATVPACTSQNKSWICCADTDDQMLVLRRSTNAGKSWSKLSYPYLQPEGTSAWPFPKNMKTSGQMVWDAKGGRVWLWVSTEHVYHKASYDHGCVGDGQTFTGMMLTHSTDLGLSWAAPLNLSTAIEPQWGPSLCITPAGGNSMLMLDKSGGPRTLLLMAEVPGTVPGQNISGDHVMIHITSLPDGPHDIVDEIADLKYNLTRSLTQPCVSKGKKCFFDEAAMAVLPGTETVFVALRSDPALTHSYATTTSTDGGHTFGPTDFNAQLFSVACEPSSVAVTGGSAGAGGLFVAAPNLGHSPVAAGTVFTSRTNMTVMGSTNGGREWELLRSVFVGPSMYSNLADGGDGSLLLFFERAFV